MFLSKYILFVSYSEEDSECDEYETEDENDEIRSLNESQFCFMEEETKSRFTNYSMSSSVIRRNEQLTLLDDKFERVSKMCKLTCMNFTNDTFVYVCL